MNIRAIAPLAAAAFVATLYFASGNIVSADPATKDEAVAMVQKAVAAIKSEGRRQGLCRDQQSVGPLCQRRPLHRGRRF